MTGEMTPVPTRILVQVREGVLNSLVEDQLRITDTRPAGDGQPGKLDHAVPIVDVIRLLAMAMQTEVAKLRQSLTAEAAPENEEWLSGLMDWIVRA